jgi:hypothetical protein
VFLSVLARYLEIKAEAAESDYMAAYARESLLRYATWMVEHERPHFDYPEQFEFPTETWAAHDLRKANVMRLAATHAAEPLRSRLLSRGNEFADRAWSDLSRFDSRFTTRPVAIMMMEGTKDAQLAAGVPVNPSRTGSDVDFGKPQPFAYQKQRIAARLKTPTGFVLAALQLADPRQWWRLKYWPWR